MKTVKKIAALFALMLTTAVWATTEVKATFASLENGATDGGYTVDGNCISGGTAWTYTDYITVIVKYSGLPASGKQAIVTLHQSNNDNKVGVYADSRVVKGIWQGSEWNNVTGQSLDESGTIVYVYAPSNSAGTTVYNASGSAIYTAPGLKASSDTFGDSINFGAKHDGSMKLDGFSVDALQILKGAAQSSEIVGLVAAFEEAIKPNTPAVEPVALFNYYRVEAQISNGWVNNTVSGGPASFTATDKNVTLSVSDAGGKFWTQAEEDSNTAFTTGSNRYTDIFGGTHDSVADEMKASLGLDASVVVDENVYKTGIMNGANSGQTATISGLDKDSKYVVYIGSGIKNGANSTSGITVETSGCANSADVELIAVKTGDTTGYQSASFGSVIQASANGSVIVRMKNVQPTEDGNIVFKLVGGKGGLNFVAVAKVNEGATTAVLSYEDNVKVSEIISALKESDNKAEVTLTPGTTVNFDAVLSVPTKLISTGFVRFSGSLDNIDAKLDVTQVAGPIERTWLEAEEKKGISFNFASKRGKDVSKALVEGTKWYHSENGVQSGNSHADGKDGSNVAMSSDGLTKISWTSPNVYHDDGSNTAVNESATMVRGYLDDSGNGNSVTVKNIPYEVYDVIIYASTDTSGKALTYKVVNETNYTYSAQTPEAAVEGTSDWGQSRQSASPAYGVNAIRVNSLTSGTLTITSRAGTNSRGGVSAIQIIPHKLAPTIAEGTILVPEVKVSSAYTSATVTLDVSNVTQNDYEVTYSAIVSGVGEIIEGTKEDNTVTFVFDSIMPGTVHRGVISLIYGDDVVLETVPLDIYAGVQTPKWETSDRVVKTAETINAAEGCTVLIKNIVTDPDYVENCDSEYTVSISASEAVEANADTELEGTEQGGVRIAQTASGLKLQVIKDGTWVDFAAAAINTTYTMKVKFHYTKTSEADSAATSVDYVVDSTTVTSGNTVGKVVSEVFIADGTVLPSDLTGRFQLDKAVVVDVVVEIGHDDTHEFEAADLNDAKAKAEKMVVAIAEDIAGLINNGKITAEQYRGYFRIQVTAGDNGKYNAEVTFKDDVDEALSNEIDSELHKLVVAFSGDTHAEIKAKPGLYYGLIRGDELHEMDVQEDMVLADGEKVDLHLKHPEDATKHFYRIVVSPTPITPATTTK